MTKPLHLHVTGHVITGKIVQDCHGRFHVHQPKKVKRTFVGVLR